MEVISATPAINSENISENILSSLLPGKSVLAPLKETVVLTEEQPEEIEEEFEESEDEEEEDENEEVEDENADALPEGCLAPEHEAMEAAQYAAELGISEGQEVLEYVGQTSWDRYDKVVDSYWKIVESRVKETQYDQCAQQATEMNKKVDQVLLKIAREILPISPAASAVTASRDAFYSFIEKAIHKAYLFTENRGDFTITSEDLREAFRLMNKQLPVKAPQNIFGDMNDYNSAEDEDFAFDEDEMAVDQEDPLEWDSDAELEEDEANEEEEDGEEEEESQFEFDHELMNDVVNHFIDIITPSDDPEEVEEETATEEKEPEINEVDVELEGIELLQQMAQEFVQSIFLNANKVCSQYTEQTISSEKALKKPLTNRDIKFVMDFCPELHF